MKTYGSNTDAEYPYLSGATGLPGTCKKIGMSTLNLLTGTGSTEISNTKAALIQALLRQPVIVGFAVSDSFYFYTSGVYNPTDCNPNYVNHAMQAIGFGTLGGLPYVLIRNSWATSWGVNGLMYGYISNTQEEYSCDG